MRRTTNLVQLLLLLLLLYQNNIGTNTSNAQENIHKTHSGP